MTAPPAYRAIMAADPELAAAIDGREHWRLDADAAETSRT